MNEVLINRDSKGEIRYLKIKYYQLPDGFYKIERSSGKLGGTDVKQPPLLIKTGKVKRTILEQVELEYNSLITKSKNKGYKLLSDFTDKPFDQVTINDLEDLNKVKTDTKGIPKPMLAKETSNFKPASWERYWFISKKLDGKIDAVFKFR